jgi:hypothetical protein
VGAGPGLASRNGRLQDLGLKALGAGVDGRGQPGRPGSDDQKVAASGGRGRPHPEGGRELGVGRVDQDLAAAEQHHRQAAAVHAGLGEQAPAVGGVLGVEAVGDADPGQGVAQLVGAGRPALADDLDGLGGGGERPLPGGQELAHRQVQALLDRQPGPEQDVVDLAEGHRPDHRLARGPLAPVLQQHPLGRRQQLLSLLEHRQAVQVRHLPGRDHQGDRVGAGGQPFHGGPGGGGGGLGQDAVAASEAPSQVIGERLQQPLVVGDHHDGRQCRGRRFRA